MQNSVSKYGIVGIARHIENFHFWSSKRQTLCQEPTAHLRHHYIRKQQGNLALVLVGDVHSVPNVWCCQNAISILLQEFASQHAQCNSVFYEKNCLRASQIGSFCCLLLGAVLNL